MAIANLRASISERSSILLAKVIGFQCHKHKRKIEKTSLLAASNTNEKKIKTLNADLRK